MNFSFGAKPAAPATGGFSFGGAGDAGKPTFGTPAAPAGGN